MSVRNMGWSLEKQVDKLRKTLNKVFAIKFSLCFNPRLNVIWIDWYSGPTKNDVRAFMEKHYPMEYEEGASYVYKSRPPLFPRFHFQPVAYCYARLGLADLTLDKVRVRLAMGDDPNEENWEQMLPLMCAIYDDNIELIKMLTAAGADWERNSIYGTPMSVLRTKCPELMKQLAEDEEKEIAAVMAPALASRRNGAL